ncbi:hypothetical protein [Asticcacaulis sp. AC402]|uniref:hypothetical protein n=1 Tax=Asticcacaulis sp. AC402 TaxID=1282361 RepID=UPI0003C3B7B1|nr:hypothetical protein [Asticcacaulis sp. AC402]ESQ75344.1 hypothetical protein ABAC402_09575 [Asticcacaulis sp. AC402]
MTEAPAYPKIFRPWLSIALLGVCLVLIVGKLVVLLLDPSTLQEAIRSLPLYLPLAALFGWYMTNRLILSAESFDHRYLWKHQVYRRADIVSIEDTRSVRGRISLVLMVREPDGRSRPIYISPPGKGGQAFVDWLRGLPGSENLSPLDAAGK